MRDPDKERALTAFMKAKERGGGFSDQDAHQPPTGTGKDRVSDQEDPDQGRGVGRTDGGARRFKKILAGIAARCRR